MTKAKSLLPWSDLRFLCLLVTNSLIVNFVFKIGAEKLYQTETHVPQKGIFVDVFLLNNEGRCNDVKPDL